MPNARTPLLATVLALTLLLTACGRQDEPTPRPTQDQRLPADTPDHDPTPAADPEPNDAAQMALPYPAPPERDPAAVVVWISLDGFRPDYLDRAETPAIDRLVEEGALSRAMRPVFPSLTFPSHVSQATGVLPGAHGIPGNTFFDAELGQRLSYPSAASLVESEPIWITAERQGVRTAVIDWTVSHSQTGDIRASYYGEGYDRRLSDHERLEQVLDRWRADNHETPLGLLMSYAVATDSAGHRYGPDADDMIPVIEETDSVVDWFVREVMDIWSERMADEDTLYLLITTDHGMSEVHTLVNATHLLGLDGLGEIATVVTSGNTANVFLDLIGDEAERAALVDMMVENASSHEFATLYRRGRTPERLGYEHPTRTGDLIAVLDTGYTFSSSPGAVTGDAAEHGGPLGMHGYDAEVNPEMDGITILWRYPEPLGGVDLGPVHALQIHATVAALLGIEPAPDAEREIFPLEFLFQPAP